MRTLSGSGFGTHVVAYTIISRPRPRLRLGAHTDSGSGLWNMTLGLGLDMFQTKVRTLVWVWVWTLGFFVFQTRSKKFENSLEHFRFQSVFLSQNHVFFDTIDFMYKVSVRDIWSPAVDPRRLIPGRLIPGRLIPTVVWSPVDWSPFNLVLDLSRPFYIFILFNFPPFFLALPALFWYK